MHLLKPPIAYLMPFSTLNKELQVGNSQHSVLEKPRLSDSRFLDWEKVTTASTIRRKLLY